MQAHVATLIAQSGPAGATAFLDDLITNETTFFGGHTDVRKAVGAGEFAIGIVNHYYYELQKREPTDNAVAVVYPDQGDGETGVIVNATAVAIVKNAPHPEAAKRFVDFLFLPETQKLFAELNYEYPIMPNISLAPGMTPLQDLNIANVPLIDIAARVNEASALMASAGVP
jgi:iron(III) transport system substrate-binding protein